MTTKEEFLDKTNINLIREVNSAFKSVELNNNLARWFRAFEKANPKLKMCQFSGKPNTDFNINYHFQSVFVNMCEALKDGRLIQKDK